MLVLAIDAATRYSGVAVVNDISLLGEYLAASKLTHSQRLLPGIDALLKDLQLSIGDLDGIAVTRGPGSFTGLRIAISLAKGLSQALDVPIIGISSLEHWAHSLPSVPGQLVLPLLDAQRGEYYSALYLKEEQGMVQLLQEEARSQAKLLNDLVPYLEQELKITGDIIPEKNDEIKNVLAKHNTSLQTDQAIPRPAVLGRLGHYYLSQGLSSDLFSLKPEYLRLSEAERQRLAREKAGGEQ